MKKVRIIDVAQEAHVSKSTVSQYMNGRFHYMSQETKARIESAIKLLNYIPNPIARSLKTDKTQTIGVIVRDITGFFTSRMIRGIDDFCKESKYNVLIYNTDFDPEVERRSLLLLKQMRVDGIIIVSSGQNNQLIAQEKDAGLPVVQVQLEYDDLQTSMVLSDYRRGSYEATEYLIQRGHKQICFMTQEYNSSRSREERLVGYKEALKANNIPFKKELVQFWERKKGFLNPLENMLNSATPPTAFFSQHLAITIDLLKEIDQLGKTIPEDLSLIGFDEIPMVDHFKVPITVIKQSPYKIGKEASKLLLATMEIPKANLDIDQVVLPCTLIERESCLDIS